MIVRNVPLDRTQVRTLEQVGEELLRDGDPRASELLAIVLQWRSLGIDVMDLPATFACNVDESAGMAEVVELNGYSRRVPCE